ncbi:MAG: hypothetical protein LJF04_07340 [Gemmatimonadetes bacterium]|nr:hypothetical protein [Gemmatimonadota bacterium]
MRRLDVAAMAAVTLLGGCVTKPNLALPTAKEVEAHYTYGGKLTARMNGNVAEVTVVQPTAQITRGGVLWAKVGPYILLFSDDTQSLFKDYPGLAAVQVKTELGGGGEIARALLTRNELSDILWLRSLNIAAKARRDGTKRPSLLDDLVRWGEEHTQYQYNKKYTST